MGRGSRHWTLGYLKPDSETVNQPSKLLRR